MQRAYRGSVGSPQGVRRGSVWGPQGVRKASAGGPQRVCRGSHQQGRRPRGGPLRGSRTPPASGTLATDRPQSVTPSRIRQSGGGTTTASARCRQPTQPQALTNPNTLAATSTRYSLLATMGALCTASTRCNGSIRNRQAPARHGIR
eukprot:4103449-Pyramimonas_sp.AAC.1